MYQICNDAQVDKIVVQNFFFLNFKKETKTINVFLKSIYQKS